MYIASAMCMCIHVLYVHTIATFVQYFSDIQKIFYILCVAVVMVFLFYKLLAVANMSTHMKSYVRPGHNYVL